MTANTNRRFGWLQFRFSTLLLLFVIMALGFGWWQDWHRRQRPLFLHVIQASIPKNTKQNERRSPPKSLAVTSIVPNQTFHSELEYRFVQGQLTVSPAGSYHLELAGNFKSGFNYDGPIRLDELMVPSYFTFASAVYPYVFAISESSDPSTLLTELGKTGFWQLGPSSANTTK